MNITQQAIEKLKEVSRDKSDFDDLSPAALADSLYEYWSEFGLANNDWKFLTKLRAA